MVDLPLLDLSSIVCYYKTINYPFLKVTSPPLNGSPIEQATHTNNGCNKPSSGAVHVKGEVAPLKEERLATKDNSPPIPTPTSSNPNSRGNDGPLATTDNTLDIPLSRHVECDVADQLSSPPMSTIATGTSATGDETNLSKNEPQTQYIFVTVNHPNTQHEETRQNLERKPNKDFNKALAPVQTFLPKNDSVHNKYTLYATLTPDALKGLKDESTVTVPESGKGVLDNSLQQSLTQEFCCRFCGALFHKKGKYDAHLNTHTASVATQKDKSPSSATRGQMRHQCQFCSASFARKYRLTIHIRTHTGEKPYQCDLCAKSFKDSDHLRRHTRTHTGNKPYKCHLCIRYFSDKEHLKRHLNVHYSGGRVRQQLT